MYILKLNKDIKHQFIFKGILHKVNKNLQTFEEISITDNVSIIFPYPAIAG